MPEVGCDVFSDNFDPVSIWGCWWRQLYDIVAHGFENLFENYFRSVSVGFAHAPLFKCLNGFGEPCIAFFCRR